MDLSELWAIFGPGVAGAVFGAGWWFWVDAVVCSSVKVSFVHYLPGIFASLAALMFNCVKKEDIDYSPYEEGEWRLKLWLFIAYVVAFVSLAASVGLLIQDSLVTTGPPVWTGVAGVLQSVFVLIRYREHNRASVHARTYFHVAICTKLGESSKRTVVRFRFDGNVGNNSQESNRVVVIFDRKEERWERGGRPNRTTLKNCF
ncbi:unnamed protein product [Prunus brigantina]